MPFPGGQPVGAAPPQAYNMQAFAPQFPTPNMGGLPRNPVEWNMMSRTNRNPQGIKPEDGDPWRTYAVRELDGGMTTRNRYTIDEYLQPVIWHRNHDGTFWVERCAE
jgi:hypothetical protein